MGNRALIGLGSNLGDRQAHLDLAVAALAAVPGVSVCAVSPYHETAPVGGPAGQGAFLNAAAVLETTRGPEELLAVLNDVEESAGRVRTVRWGERTLDIDLLLFGDRVLNTPRLRVPHPRMALRRFVLAPLAEVAPDAIDPVTGRSVRDLLANLDRRPGYVAIASRPRLRWPGSLPAVADPRVLPLLLLSRQFGTDGAGLAGRLREALPAEVVEDRMDAEDLNRVGSIVLSDPEDFDRLQRDCAGRWLHAQTLAGSVPVDRWVVSSFWFDSLFLALDALKTTRPRFPRYRARFLEARADVLPPTFVVARPQDREHLGIQDPRYAWHRPIGWDTPVLTVDDFDSDEALAEVIAACAATRTG